MRVVRSGQLVLVPIAEVERWLQRNAHVVVDAVGPQLVPRAPQVVVESVGGVVLAAAAAGASRSG